MINFTSYEQNCFRDCAVARIQQHIIPQELSRPSSFHHQKNIKHSSPHPNKIKPQTFNKSQISIQKISHHLAAPKSPRCASEEQSTMPVAHKSKAKGTPPLPLHPPLLIPTTKQQPANTPPTSAALQPSPKPPTTQRC